MTKKVTDEQENTLKLPKYAKLKLFIKDAKHVVGNVLKHPVKTTITLLAGLTIANTLTGCTTQTPDEPPIVVTPPVEEELAAPVATFYINHLEWSAVKGATFYSLYVEDQKYIFDAKCLGTNLFDLLPDAGKEYSIKIRAENETEQSPFSYYKIYRMTNDEISNYRIYSFLHSEPFKNVDVNNLVCFNSTQNNLTLVTKNDSELVFTNYEYTDDFSHYYVGRDEMKNSQIKLISKQTYDSNEKYDEFAKAFIDSNLLNSGKMFTEMKCEYGANYVHGSSFEIVDETTVKIHGVADFRGVNIDSTIGASSHLVEYEYTLEFPENTNMNIDNLIQYVKNNKTAKVSETYYNNYSVTANSFKLTLDYEYDKNFVPPKTIWEDTQNKTETLPLSNGYSVDIPSDKETEELNIQ